MRWDEDYFLGLTSTGMSKHYLSVNWTPWIPRIPLRIWFGAALTALIGHWPLRCIADIMIHAGLDCVRSI